MILSLNYTISGFIIIAPQKKWFAKRNHLHYDIDNDYHYHIIWITGPSTWLKTSRFIQNTISSIWTFTIRRSERAHIKFMRLCNTSLSTVLTWLIWHLGLGWVLSLWQILTMNPRILFNSGTAFCYWVTKIWWCSYRKLNPICRSPFDCRLLSDCLSTIYKGMPMKTNWLW